MDLKPWIYIVLLGIAAVLYAFMLPKRREETVSSERVVKEVENTLEGYMAEIQNENEQLVELVSQMKKNWMPSSKHIKSRSVICGTACWPWRRR